MFVPMLLAEREKSSMASCWNESLLLKQNDAGHYYLAECGHEVLGSIYELPEDEIYDDDGNLITPTHYNGQPVLDLEDGEWLVGAELLERESSKPFDLDSLERAEAFLEESGWSSHPDVAVIREAIRAALAGTAPIAPEGAP